MNWYVGFISPIIFNIYIKFSCYRIDLHPFYNVDSNDGQYIFNR